MKYELFTYSLLSCAWCASATFLFTPVVTIEQGKLRGLRSASAQNRYYGIPYGTGERFRPPKPPKKWDGIFNAVNPFTSCAQAVAFLQLGTEDCLQLDVYTPGDTQPGDNLPVLVFIHGGGYYYGSKWQYDPEFLVTKNVVVVIINYRVGVLGFLCLNDVANLGLKDQVAALKWIQKNIRAFGGDPDNVTISGQSAGASAASMHFLSKTSEGLFHKAFLMSGTAITPWAFNVEPLKPAYEDAAKIRTVKNEQDVYKTFLEANVRDLLKASLDTSINPRYFKYTPCVDSNSPEPFFHDTPYDTIKSGAFNKVPMIVGVTDVEGMLFYGLHNVNTLQKLSDELVEMLPSVFSWCSLEDKRIIAQRIHSHYFSNRTAGTKDSIKGVIDLYSDWVAYASVDAFSQMISNHSDKPVFNYIMSYEGDRNFAKALFGVPGLAGASHSDDIFYIFQPGGLSLLLSRPDKLFIDRWTTMITNFMKYGDPTPRTTKLLPVRWPAARANGTRAMRLDRRLTVADIPTSHKGGFLLNLLCTYGLRGYVPCDSQMDCRLGEHNDFIDIMKL